jgi:protein SCO1/2
VGSGALFPPHDPIHRKTELFLQIPLADVQRICNFFGVNFVPDEGLYIHSLHTAVIGRDGRLLANLEGNDFTAQQLGDLVNATLDGVK